MIPPSPRPQRYESSQSFKNCSARHSLSPPASALVAGDAYNAVMRLALSLFAAFATAAVLFVTASVILAWTGPTATPPNNNVAAPINVGIVDQIKNGGLGVNSLAVFGNAIISTVNGYLNFGPTAGFSGYGFRDSAGTMQYKNSGGSWSSFSGGSSGGVSGDIGPISKITFTDNTTQTTAGGGDTTIQYQPGMSCGYAMMFSNCQYPVRIACNGSHLSVTCYDGSGGGEGGWDTLSWTGCPSGFTAAPLAGESAGLFTAAICVKN